MSDKQKHEFLNTLDKMGKLAASIQDICPQVFVTYLCFWAFCIRVWYTNSH